MTLAVQATRRHLLGVMAVTCFGCVPDVPIRSDVDALVASVACAAEVRETFATWRAGPTFIGAPPGPDGSNRYRVRAGGVGDWIVLTTLSRQPPRLVRWSGHTSTSVRFSPSCEAITESTVARVGGVSAGGEGFTDDELRTRIDQANGPLVVYAWSPHMPLSVDGYREIAEAGRRLGVEVIPVLFAEGDRDFARREAQRGGIPEAGLREVASTELLMRDAQVHAPSIVVFTPDRVSPVLPGYRNADGYVRYVAGFLARPEK